MTTEEAIKALEIASAEVEWNYPMDYAAAFDMAVAALRAQQEWEPAADVQPVRHGQWGPCEVAFPGHMTGRNLGVFCSICNCYADNPTAYCPNCGAKMDGEDGVDNGL